MGSPSAVRSRRRSAGQLHALAGLQREILATDPNPRRKYLRDFSEAFRGYESLLTLGQLESELRQADVVLIGDYHALPASQRFAAQIVEQVAKSGRQVVLGVETVLARDQHILDEWTCGEIDDDELRQRIRFDLDWGYAWEPFRELLAAARQHALGVYGLDCMPRDDLRKIARRDRHAARKIAEIASRHPNAIVVVLFGESHLAPNHIPELLRQALPDAGIVTLLQNVDHLYWRAAGERREHVEAVRVENDVLCVFNATPLEKYESYRQCIERWRQEAAVPDLAPTFYNLVDALSRFLNIDEYASHNGTQPVYLVDRMPEVSSQPSEEAIARLLLRKGAGEEERTQVLVRIATSGCCYVPRVNTIFVREFQMASGAEEAARFVHHACLYPAAWDEAAGVAAEERFYASVVEHALGYFGSRVLCPSRPAARGFNLGELSAQAEDAGAERSGSSGKQVALAAEKLGYMLGSELYDAYVAGRLSRRYIRSLFFRKLGGPAARSTCLQIARKARSSRG
jgi:Haem-binding uptake, Tiki superfamily, ChaN